jgi:hypothetical protein
VNTDERRALKILHEKFPDSINLVGQFIDFLRQRKSKYSKPEEIASEFLEWVGEK